MDLSGPRAILVGGGPVPLEVLEEAIGRDAAVVQTYGLTETASQVTTLAPAGGATQAGLRRAAAADHSPADPGRRDPRPGPGRRAGLRRRGRLAPHRRPGPNRRRGLPVRRGPAGRRDRQRGRERAARRGRGGPAAPPGRRRRRRGRPGRRRVAGGGGGRGRACATAPRRAPRSCADTVPSRLPATRCRSASSSSPSCRAPTRASSCAGRCADAFRGGWTANRPAWGRFGVHPGRHPCRTEAGYVPTQIVASIHKEERIGARRRRPVALGLRRGLEVV